MNEEDTIPGREGGLLPEEAAGFPQLPRVKKQDVQTAVLSVAARLKRIEDEFGLLEEEDSDGEDV